MSFSSGDVSRIEAITSILLLSTQMIYGVYPTSKIIRTQSFVGQNFCGNDPNCNTPFACNNGTGSWNNGSITWKTDENQIVVQITVEVRGKFNCAGEGAIFSHLNNKMIFTQSNRTRSSGGQSGCNCSDCNTSIRYEGPMTNGLSEYYNGKSNTVQISANYTICISDIIVTVNYTDISSSRKGIVLPTCGPLTGGTSTNLYMDVPNATDVPFMCAWKDRGGSIYTTDDLSVSSGGFTCITPPVPHAGDMSMGFYFPFSDYFVPLEIDFITDPFWTFYRQPTSSHITLGSCDKQRDEVMIIGEGFVNGSCRSQICIWKNGPIISQKTTGHVLNSTHYTCDKPATLPPNGSTVAVSVNTEVFTPQTVSYICLGGSDPNEEKTSLPGWSYVLFIFGGATAIAVAILAISQRSLAKRRDGEQRALSAGHLSSDNNHLIYRSIEFSALKCMQRIGKGTFGEVYKGMWNGTEVAIKFSTMSNMNAEFSDDFNKEVSIMRGLRHPNILQFLGACTTMPNVCIVMEYMPLGSSYKILHDDFSEEIDTNLVKRMMLDAARGMNYSHKSQPIIIHRDLKSHNLLVDENWKVKVCDFGLSKILETKSEFSLMTACGTPSWSAPEISRSERYTEKVDIYSFGIVSWECVTREDPYAGMAPYQVVIAVGTKFMRPTVPSDCPPKWAESMKDCWKEDPLARPSFDDIMDRILDL